MRHETPKNREDEKKAIAIYAKFVGLESEKLPDSQVLDFAMLHPNGKIDHYVEFKRREISVNKYSDIMLSLRKIRMALDYLGYDTKVVFLVEWVDVMGYMIITDHPTYLKLGPDDRGDPNDLEPVGFYDIASNFQRVEQKE